MLIALLSVLMAGLAIVLAVPTLVLLLEIAFGRSLSNVPAGLHSSSDVRAMIIVPAHNEQLGISATVIGLVAQCESKDRLVVVADNCSDETASLARTAGAEVLERHDADLRGKGYALAYGLAEARSANPDVVIFVDADCTLSPGSINILKEKAWTSRRPVQAAFVMEAPVGHEARYAVATFAWRIKNLVRPFGLLWFGLPCQMMGTGMAMRLDIANTVAFASGNIVEDLELGLNLASSGHPPLLEPGVLVRSYFPVTHEGEITQRRRWEGGSMAMLASRSLRVIGKAIASLNLPLLALGLDMLVPPLVTHGALLAMFWIASAAVSLLCGTVIPVAAASGLAFLFVLALGIAWVKAGRDVLPLRSWRQLLLFVRKKLKIHKALPGAHTSWVRADRRTDDSE